MSVRILELVRNELYLDFRYLDMALSSLVFSPKEELKTIATDGASLFFSREQILRVFKNNPLFLNRTYLHSVLHCIFRHLWMRKNREPVLWNIACDIAVEQVIDSFDKNSTKRALSLVRSRYYEHLKKEKIPVTAAAVYRDLLSVTDPEEQLELQLEFYTDDHRFWPRDASSSLSSEAIGKQWEKIGRRASKDIELRGNQSSSALSSVTSQIALGKSRRSYQEFLKKFTVLQEELHCNYDEFDLNYYTYGLQIYQNMPLIEPLETREVKKISEFVIVIDTSYSTDGLLVRRFLRETFRIITQRDSFFKKSHIRILQCDNQVRSDTVITSESDIERLLQNFSLIGGGGTDFRPAFAYVDKLLSQGTLRHLKGLLYFTDGQGIYPARRPPYDTAFLFMGDADAVRPVAPVWAMVMHLNEEDFDL
ncbi:MAG: VWA-like domain-containing protein [Eubacteriales bacterium]|nr:VWA-like domain-containing protein [Eubacteriales bacterium]